MSRISSEVVNIPFKLFIENISSYESILNLNGLTYNYDVLRSNNINNFMNNFNYKIKTDFGVSRFELVPHFLGEKGQDIKQYLMSIYRDNYEDVPIGQFIDADIGFYVRPISLTEQDIIALREIQELSIQSCPVCFSSLELGRYNRHFTCQHEMCRSCFETWHSRRQHEGRETTCPICRSE